MPDYKVVVYELTCERPNGAPRARTEVAKRVDVFGKPDAHCALVAAAKEIDAENARIEALEAGVRVLAPSPGGQENGQE